MQFMVDESGLQFLVRDHAPSIFTEGFCLGEQSGIVIVHNP